MDLRINCVTDFLKQNYLLYGPMKLKIDMQKN